MLTSKQWDGVAAVPVSVGCLKYPAWLTRLPQENDRDELRYYRAMYAQYVEALVPCDQASGTTGKMGADITRMSLITGPLEVAVNYPEDTDQTVKHFYREIDRLVGEIDVADLSDSEFPGSDIGPGVGSDQSVSEELNTDAPLSGTEVEATDSGEETERTEVTEASSGSLDHSNGTSPEPLCQETLHTSSPEALDGWKDGKDFSAPGMTPREAPRIEKGDELELSSFVHDLANEAAQDQSAATAQNYEAEFTAPDLVEEGCKEVAEVLCPKATTKVGPSRKVRMLRWVMGLDEKGCKEASKAFHKQDGASHQQIKLGTEPASEQYSSLAYSRTGKVAIRLCDQAEILLRNLIARVHRDSEDSEESTSMETKTESGQDSLKSVINMLGNLIGMLPGNGVAQVETPAPARERLPQETVPFDTAHCQKCSSSDANPGPETTDQKQWFAGIDSEHVWACIAADVDKAGISISMIKEHRDAITQCVIQKLGRDIGREKQGELHLKKEAVQKAKKAPKQTKVTNTDPLCNPVPIQHPCLDDSRPTKPASPRTHLAETDGAPLRVPEERVVDIVDGKADITHPLVTASLPGVKGVLGQEIEIPVLGKPVPEGTVCLRVPPVAPGGPNMDVFHPDQYNIDFRSSESESLLSKLEAAKQRFDTEMAMREQKCKYIRLAPVHDGAEASQLGDARQKTSEHDFSTLEAIEEGNQKLRMILESFAKSYEASSGLTQTSPHAVEDDGATTMQLEFPESKNSKRGARPSEAVHLANQKLRTNLSSLQTPLVFNANVQSNICRIAEGDDEELESVAAQCQKPVRGGRWFETPRGSLKRIKDEDTVNFSVNGQETVAKTSSPSSSNDDRILAVTSVVSDEHQEGGMAQVSDFQLLFPNPIQSETVNHFQVPDTDEDADSDEEDCDAENIAQNNNGDEDDELEEGELREGGVRLDGMGQGDVQVETANRVSADREASQNSELEKTVDHGNFNMEEVCVALGNGNLDQQRMRRLKAGFKMMMAEALGRM